MDSKVVRADFGSGLICPRAQTCMDSKVVRADFRQRTDLPPGSNMHGLKSGSCRFWQRTDLPPGSNMLRRAAQTCSACKLAGVQIIPLLTLANQIFARTFFRFVALQLAYQAVGKFSRASSAGGRLNLQSSIKPPDRVGRRGLSEPREDFSRLPHLCMDSNVVRAEFGSGLICPRTQTCCALKSSAPFGARQDNCADLLGLQTRQGSNHSAAHVSESNSRSNVFQIRRASVCVPSR